MKPEELTSRNRAALIYRAATLAAELLPYAVVLESDVFTSDERARFRELAGQARVFALAEALRPLCSPDAHALHRARKAGVALTLINTRTGCAKSLTFTRTPTSPIKNRRDR